MDDYLAGLLACWLVGFALIDAQDCELPLQMVKAKALPVSARAEGSYRSIGLDFLTPLTSSIGSFDEKLVRIDGSKRSRANGSRVIVGIADRVPTCLN